MLEVKDSVQYSGMVWVRLYFVTRTPQSPAGQWLQTNWKSQMAPGAGPRETLGSTPHPHHACEQDAWTIPALLFAKTCCFRCRCESKRCATCHKEIPKRSAELGAHQTALAEIRE